MMLGPTQPSCNANLGHSLQAIDEGVLAIRMRRQLFEAIQAPAKAPTGTQIAAPNIRPDTKLMAWLLLRSSIFRRCAE
jgi:hypothetical protein